MDNLNINTTDAQVMADRWRTAINNECTNIVRKQNPLSKLFNLATSFDYDNRILKAKKLKLQAIENIFREHESIWRENKFKDINIFKHLIGENEYSVLILRELFNLIEPTSANLQIYFNWTQFKSANYKLSQKLIGLGTTIEYRTIMPELFYQTISPGYSSILIDLAMYMDDYPNVLDLNAPQHKQLIKCILNSTELFYRTQQNDNTYAYQSLHTIFKDKHLSILKKVENLYTKKENIIISLINILHLCNYHIDKHLDEKKYVNIKTLAEKTFKHLYPEEYHKMITMQDLGIEDLNVLYNNITFTQINEDTNIEMPIFTLN